MTAWKTGPDGVRHKQDVCKVAIEVLNPCWLTPTFLNISINVTGFIVC